MLFAATTSLEKSMEKQSTSAPSAAASLIPIQAKDAYRILVINGKGSAGKTTISTNLAAWLAYRDQATALLDANPQGSASAWVEQRSANRPLVYGFKAGSSQSKAPATEWLITDAAAGISGEALNDLVLNHDLVLVPVIASDVDIRSSTRFIGELLLTPAMRRQRRPMAVIANRIKQPTEAWERLQKFLNSLKIPHPATLRDSQNYLRAHREGLGVVDYQQQGYLRDRADWEALVQWIDEQHADYLRRKSEAVPEKPPLV